MKIFVMIGLICAGISLAAGAAFAKDETFSLKIGGRERSWLVHTPTGYDGKKPLPLVLVLHGGGGNYPSIVESSQFSLKADKEGFIAVYPNGTGRLKGIGLTWNAGNGSGYALENKVDDVGFFRELIAWLKNKYAVDSQRIFVTGLSNGGMMTCRLACELSDLIAAAGIVSGALAVDSPAPARPVSVIVFHGTADEHILYNGGTPKKTIDYPIRNDQPVSFAIDFWVKQDRCAAVPVKEEKGAIIHDTYTGGTDNAAVELYTITGGGHAWPGGKKGSLAGDEPTREISATDLIWDFFVRHARQ